MIYTIGETVIDIIINSFDDVKMRPGGSMLNTALSLGRSKMQVAHVSYVAADTAANMLLDFLAANSVNISFVKQCNNIKTNLALAFLDNNQKASYSFYKYQPENMGVIEFPIAKGGDVIHFGSFFGLNPQLNKYLSGFLQLSKNNGAFIVYDPNFREPLKNQLATFKPFIENNFRLSNIVKASDEDMNFIFNVKNGRDAWDVVKNYGVKCFIYTKGENGSELFTNNIYTTTKAKKVKVVSTVGAGDTFSAAVIFWLLKNNAEFDFINFDLENATKLLKFATNCAAQVCSTNDNYLPVNYLSNNINV